MNYYEIGQGKEDKDRPKEIYIQVNMDELDMYLKKFPDLVTMNNLEEPQYDEDQEEIDQPLYRYITVKLKRLQSNSDKFNVYVLDWKPKERD